MTRDCKGSGLDSYRKKFALHSFFFGRGMHSFSGGSDFPNPRQFTQQKISKSDLKLNFYKS